MFFLWWLHHLLALTSAITESGGEVKVTAAEWIHGSNELQAGQEYELLMNVYNGGSKPIQIFSLSVSIRDAKDLNQELRTLTPARLLVEVPVEEHFNIPFRFKPDADLGMVGLEIMVDYTDKARTTWQRVRGWRGVVSVIEAEQRNSIDWKLLLALSCLLIVLLSPWLLRHGGKNKKK